ncbi:MAG TPA: peptide-methionine (S)-S-oxide reductase MsrA [Patescibacteria group bacterium]|nr:peptide-methionine (S)-S-oxide reductase MsrA [Patescibacteria group bacterium]
MKKYQMATFGAGCFWGVEEAYRILPGIHETTVGFMGGKVKDPTYQQVCDNNTGHAEVVHVKFDPALISYADLLKKFWEIHDPTQENRQGPDIGDQYRSVIFYHSEAQQAQAENSKSVVVAEARFTRTVVTAIEPASEFYPAEEYHQKYFLKNGGGACHI